MCEFCIKHGEGKKQNRYRTGSQELVIAYRSFVFIIRDASFGRGRIDFYNPLY
jgi:hypothetical protein